MRRVGLLALSLNALLLLWWCRPGASATGGPDGAIICAASWTAWLAATYLGAAATAALLTADRMSGSVVAAPLPRCVRRVVDRALGVGVAAVVTTGLVTTSCGGVAAADGSGPRPPAVSVDWPTASPAGPSRSVRVEAGDCLWDIAANRLAHPTPARIAATWPRWWRANRRVVGADPDVLHPGQRLRPPIALRSES